MTRNPNLKPPTLRRHLMKLGIAECKLPDHIRLIETLPLPAVGKIDKKHLRQLLAAETTRTWLQTRVLQLIEDCEDLDPEENLIFYRGGLGSATTSRSDAGFWSSPSTFTRAYRNNCLNQVRHFSAVVKALRCSIPLRRCIRSWRLMS